MTARLSIGIGCSSRATAEDLLRLIAASLDLIPDDCVLATLDRRAAIAKSVASALRLRLVLLPASVLAGMQGALSQSSVALAATGTASVAEAAALAALGPAARLVMPRRVGHFCTCAIAAAPRVMP